MITRIEIDGFKSFRNFQVNLKPFQVLIGPNGVGKSNLFDAIVLLSHLAGDNSLHEAFRKNRGEVNELFSALPDGSQSKEMKFAVEMLIDRTVTDMLGVTAEVTSTRLRYELHIERRSESGFERLFVAYERLNAIIEDEDTWFKENIPTKTRKRWLVRRRRSTYISTESETIAKSQEGRSGRKQTTPLGRIERTILSTTSSAAYPTAYAARKEMQNWRFLQFNPDELRSPSHIYDRIVLESDGSNLAAVLWRLSQEDNFALSDISIDMANLVGLLRVSVQLLSDREEFIIKAETKGGNAFSSRVLSDGTLRLLALVTLKHDPMHQGVMCFEEPENGVHPQRLQQIVEVLKSLATDFASEEDGSPRQVLINTHSPRLTSFVDLTSLLFVYTVRGNQQGTRMTPVSLQKPLNSLDEKAETHFTLDQVKEYLDPSTLQKGIDRLLEMEREL